MSSQRWLTGPEDIDLLRRICLRGDVVETPGLIANIERGNVGSTTNYNQHSEMSRRARENILDEPFVFSRLKEGANSTFWLGKLLRIYFSSVIWNMQQNRIFVAGSRLIYGLFMILSSNFRMLSKDFWLGLMTPYQSPTFERGIRLSGRKFD